MLPWHVGVRHSILAIVQDKFIANFRDVRGVMKADEPEMTTELASVIILLLKSIFFLFLSLIFFCLNKILLLIFVFLFIVAVEAIDVVLT